MMQELGALYMSDIVQLLGVLGLLSLGIVLILWGLKCRRSGVVVMALLLCLAALVPTVLAIEIPPVGSVAQIQTSGPNTPLYIGDWYTSRNPDAGGPGYHSFNIYVPCTIPSGQTITVELFDPESNNTTGNVPPDLDEIRPRPENPVPDNTMFTLRNPSGDIIAETTYTPFEGTSQNWVTFATFTPGTNGCGIYTLRVTTSDDDDNAWRLRVTPDGTPGTGDEISLGNLQTSFQHDSFGCQTFHFFVPDMEDPIRLSNFDMDVPVLCENCTVAYTDPSGGIRAGTVSTGTAWNGTTGYFYPPPGGDVIADPEPGWWQAELCLNDDNQYIFDTGGLTYFHEKPPTPDMSVSKDDGTTTFSPGGVLTYTIAYTNDGPGAALDAVLTDTLPDYTTFLSCSGGLSCGEIPPGSGIVIFQLGTIISETSGSVMVSVQVDDNAPAGSITNTVELDYTDVIFSDYPPESDTDVDSYEPTPAIELAKTVYAGHNSGVSCPGGELVVGENGDAVTYCFVVTNTGDTYLDDITINDADLGIPPAAVVLLSGSTPLAPGGSLVYYYQSTITGDLLNTATTQGNPTDSGGNDLPGLDNPTDDDTAEVDQIGPGIEIAKTVYLGHDSGASCPGSEIVTDTTGADVTYCFEVTNTGDTYLDSIVITDTTLAIPPATVVLLSGSTPLSPGDSLVYYYQGTINGNLVNTAQTEGNPTESDGTDIPDLPNPTDDDDATVNIFEFADPAIAKSGDPTVASPGEIVTFTLRVTNGGATDASGVVVTDVIPAYLSIRTVTTTKGTVQTIVGNTVVVEIGTIAGNNSEVVVITIVTEVRAGTPAGTVMENQASLTFSEGDPRQSNPVYVEVPGEAPAPKPKRPKQEGPEPGPPAPPPATPATPTPTPPVEVVTVAMLPETGGLPGLSSVFAGLSIMIGVVSLLLLSLPRRKDRRGGDEG